MIVDGTVNGQTCHVITDVSKSKIRQARVVRAVLGVKSMMHSNDKKGF